MNTITQIENALKSINQAKFQILVNHLLYLKGYKYIGAPGASVGKEKTSKGTPDSYFVENNNFIFVECTTQEKIGKSKSFFNKLSEDIDHCFNQEQTRISKDKIVKVILACNEKVNPKEFDLLQEKIKLHNSETKFELITIQSLSFDLFEFPKLIDEYLNIQVVKGDINTLDDFLLKTEKGLQPSLTNKFIGREQELQNCFKALEQKDILFLSGSAGVGKSKLAVKILEDLSKEEYIPIVIQSSTVPLWEDFKHLFSSGKKHIILFDDANKSVHNLEYLLSSLEGSKPYATKVIITSRDYVKKQVLDLLNSNYSYKEFNIPEFKDEEISKIIINALSNLRYHHDIKRKIIDLAKGNARVALMATYSVTPDSETNYLKSPVLLYEKYFKKISEELDIFNKPIILQSLAIVSFFGILDRNNQELKDLLTTKFNLDWNELWSAIIELHNSEILDVYSEEIVKVSDQVLATYAFYKCFIDEKSAVINYSDWISVFIQKDSHRIRRTLIDVNNTFDYSFIKNLVLPHLNEVIKKLKTDEEYYSFYTLFWFYKDRDCLIYLKNWITDLPQQQVPEKLSFNYVHNNHTTATKYFDLLREFWYHSNELLIPSLDLTFKLLNKEPNRLPEILKFIVSDFKYKIQDLESNYSRQNKLLDILLESNLDNIQKTFNNGIFLNFAKELLGWHYTEDAPTKGNYFTIYNFDLVRSDNLLNLRARILNQVYELFNFDNKESLKILNQIIYPGGNIDKSIYVEELTIYQRIISDKLDKTQYAHCKFVSVLAKYFTEAGAKYPENWNEFINSDIRKLSFFLKPNWEYRRDKSIEDSEAEKRQEFNDFVKTNNWQNLENFLLKVNELYIQQKDTKGWNIQQAMTDIYCYIARKDKSELENALRLFFSGEVRFTLHITVIEVICNENIMTGKEIIAIMNDYQFKGKTYWESVVIARLPKEQVDHYFLKLLIENFKRPDEYSYVYQMLDYIKYDTVFEEYKKNRPDLINHNIITYLTSILITKTHKTIRDFGIEFCSSCAPYFIKQSKLLKDSYWIQYKNHSHFDYNGNELKAILDFDKNFIKESILNNTIGLDYKSQVRLENINLDNIWDYDEYETLVEEILLTIVEKAESLYIIEDDIISLFQLKAMTNKRTQRIKELILKLTIKHSNNNKLILILIEIVYSNYREWFMELLKLFFITNKDIELTKRISFGRMQTTSGSWVPVYQKKIEFYQSIIDMIKTLPNILDYSQHIYYFEERITCKKKDIERELKNDFMDEYY